MTPHSESESQVKRISSPEVIPCIRDKIEPDGWDTQTRRTSVTIGCIECTARVGLVTVDM